jgi:transcriptional regulator with XRE-family HTH domain
LRRFELAERVIELREGAGLTQEAAAKRAGVGVTTWSNIETGTITRPHPRTLIKIARGLGVEPEDLTVPKGQAQRPDTEDAALAVLFRGLAQRGRKIVQQSVEAGASEQLGRELAEYHREAAALHRITGGRDIHGKASEELHEAQEAYQEAESRIQAMLAQDFSHAGEEVRTRRLRSNRDTEAATTEAS